MADYKHFCHHTKNMVKLDNLGNFACIEQLLSCGIVVYTLHMYINIDTCLMDVEDFNIVVCL